MRRFDPGGLSDQAVIGLTAELSALRSVVVSAVGEAAGVDAWRGPCGVAHDFVLTGCDIEVKGSTEHPPKRIEIANLDQLDARPNAILLLSIFEIAEDNAGASLPDTVASLRAVIMEHAPEALTGFDDRLLRAGYSDAQADLYRTRYSVRNVSFYRVEKGFPRLVPSDMPSGVERVRYAIDLAAAASFRLSGDTVPDLISEAGGRHGA
jgi:hypothetical protein